MDRMTKITVPETPFGHVLSVEQLKYERFDKGHETFIDQKKRTLSEATTVEELREWIGHYML